jgi:hypothetical protein
MFLRFAAADRERFGVPDWVEFDASSITLGEAEALEEAGGDWTILMDGGMKATRSRLWLILFRAGYVATEGDLKSINLVGLESQADMPGKGDAESAPSAPAASPTSRTSATSTRRSPRKRSSTSA